VAANEVIFDGVLHPVRGDESPTQGREIVDSFRRADDGFLLSVPSERKLPKLSPFCALARLNGVHPRSLAVSQRPPGKVTPPSFQVGDVAVLFAQPLSATAHLSFVSGHALPTFRSLDLGSDSVWLDGRSSWSGSAAAESAKRPDGAFLSCASVWRKQSRTGFEPYCPINFRSAVEETLLPIQGFAKCTRQDMIGAGPPAPEF
jgi:hypothetical protein